MSTQDLGPVAAAELVDGAVIALRRLALADSGWPCTRHLDGAVLHVDIDLDTVTK